MRNQETIVVVERGEGSHFTGLLDQTGQPIMAREIREPIGFYILGEEDEEQKSVRS